ncbi:hypothetical protein DRJ48_02415 [Candidatus Woesearchaeota archaeon]|nr:MAG: hypothetical protein DRJ48_02415 [Candidatus Woesearchaeota archaeon]
MVRTVFVLDGRSRAALQVVRSLGKRGVKVIIGNDSWVCSSFFSRFVSKRVVYPNPKTKGFKRLMFALLQKEKIDVVIPVRDDTTLFFSRYKEELSKFSKIPVADFKTIMKGRDKSQTIEIAKRAKVPIPKTIIVNSLSDVLANYKKIGFPMVLKPAISTGSRGLFLLRNKDQLDQLRDSLFHRYGKYLMQEFIPSQGNYGLNVLFNDKSELRAVFVYKRLRDYPRGMGPSVLRMSVVNDEIKKYGVRLFKAMRWQGVGMAEFKVDTRDNKPKLMEVNPRFWGSLALPIYAGVDFPYLLFKMALEGDVTPVIKYKQGVLARWLLLGDLLWLLKSKDKLHDLKEFLKFFRKNQIYDIISLKDPLPALGALLEGLEFIFKKKKREHAFNRGVIF